MSISVEDRDGTWHQIGANAVLTAEGSGMPGGDTVVTTPSFWELHAQWTADWATYERMVQVIRTLTGAKRQRLSRMHSDYRRKKRGHR